MAIAMQSEFDDGTPVRFLLSPAPPGAASGRGDDLPEGMGTSVPVATGRRGVADFATGALRSALAPLGVLLQEVHGTVNAVPEPPSEMSVTFGVQVGHDLKFGIVSGGGQAHLTVTATWQPPRADGGTATPGPG
ncbi:CU044_2847 family protein [Streptomyces sp. MBT65]|uniref:CU044_2847 family protein n=1 Tax=Streptomyces sp. MBT65 TaxID=1488395 RepID=UPI0027DA631E|nr:CU044_2847 family protein [Streptomyces sp. MBT65]